MTQGNAIRARASKSCGNCRAVKRRCDLQVPHCGQCIRTREECPGYRDEWDLVFRDQTSHIIKRSKRLREKSAASTPTQTTHFPLSRRPTIGPSFEEIGINYFFRSFVVGAESSSRGYLNYVPAVYRVDGGHAALVASVAAVGLVALAKATQRPELASRARAKYAEAIHKVNAALASPTESAKDSTLMSVISLGVFEHVSEYLSWVRHVEGAAALVVARGKSRLSSPVAIRMFNQVRADLVLTCLHDDKPFPEDMLELQEEAAKSADTLGSIWLLGVLGTRCANLLFRARRNHGDIHWHMLLQEALLIERSFQLAVETLVLEEPFTTTSDTGLDPDMVQNGRVDLYKDSWSIRVWDNCRNVQMILYETMWYLLSKVLSTDLATTVREQLELKLKEIPGMLSKLCDDVLATVPQALGLVPSAPGCSPAAQLPLRGSVSGGYMVSWCLYMVGKCAITKSATRKWAIRQLQDIGSNMGIAIALQLVQDVIEIDRLAG